MTALPTQIWDLWYPGAAAQDLAFARGRLDATGVLPVHAAPPTLDVVVRDVTEADRPRPEPTPGRRPTAGATDSRQRTHRPRGSLAGGDRPWSSGHLGWRRRGDSEGLVERQRRFGVALMDRAHQPFNHR